jgi:Putative metal-binding motif
VIAKAVDRVGNFATATAGITIAPPPGSVPVDRDGDGSLDTADCNDTNSSIHPGAPEVPGNGVDDDCAGGDAPGTVAATVLNNWTAGRKSSRVTTLKARNVPAGATIETRCTGHGCPFKLKRLAVAKAGDVDLRSRYFKHTQLRVGAVLEIRILAPNRIAKVARFTIRSHKAPLSRYLCLAPGAKKAGPCT